MSLTVVRVDFSKAGSTAGEVAVERLISRASRMCPRRYKLLPPNDDGEFVSGWLEAAFGLLRTLAVLSLGSRSCFFVLREHRAFTNKVGAAVR